MNYNTAVQTPTGDPTSPITTTVTTNTGTSGGKSLGYWLGLFAFLAIMVWVARKAGSAEDFRNIRPTLYNFLTITLTAIVGIVGLKVIFAKYRIPGASDVVLAA
jgi:hypothetical protein